MFSNEQYEIGSVNHVRGLTRWSMLRRHPDFHTLVIVTGGSLEYSIQGETYTIARGEILLMPAGMTKSGKSISRKPHSKYSVTFFGDLPSQLDTGQGHKIVDGSVKEITAAFDGLYRHWLAGDDYCSLGYLQVILGLLPTPCSEKGRRLADPRVERMRRYLVDHVEEKTDLAALSTIAGVSRAYAGTLFQKHTGVKIQHYANALRVRKAQALLTESWDTLASIAAQCGFDNAFYFSTVFKQHTGQSPQAYRQRHG